MDDKMLDKVMHERFVPEMRSNLCRRIVHAALQGDQGENVGWFFALFDGLMLPRPAVSMACLVLLGMMVGTMLDAEYLSNLSEADPAEYMMVDDFFETEFEMSVLQIGEGK